MSGRSAAGIVCFSTGRVRPKRGRRGLRRYLPGGWDSATLPVNVFALDHPEGVCVFDAGQTARAGVRGYFPAWWPYFRLARFELSADDEVAPQLGRRGLPASRVRWLVLSHLHTDHAGGVGGLAGAEVVVSRVEWTRATGLRGRLRGYLPQYWPQGVEPRLVDFAPPPIGPFSGSYDLAGDGSLRLVPTPGHTPGHMSLLGRIGSRRVLLGGDMAPSAGRLKQLSPAVAEYCERERITPLLTHDPQACELAAAALGPGEVL